MPDGRIDELVYRVRMKVDSADDRILDQTELAHRMANDRGAVDVYRTLGEPIYYSWSKKAYIVFMWRGWVDG